MLGSGRIDLHRSLTKWRWYKNGNTMRLFIHLLLTANWKDDGFEQITVRRGQRVASRRGLAEETGMTEREIRTALNHLISTGEVTSKSYTKYTVITIENYDRYQAPTGKTTSKRPANDHKIINIINIIKLIKIIIFYLYLIYLARVRARTQKRSELETCAQMR